MIPASRHMIFLVIIITITALFIGVGIGVGIGFIMFSDEKVAEPDEAAELATPESVTTAENRTLEIPQKVNSNINAVNPGIQEPIDIDKGTDLGPMPEVSIKSTAQIAEEKQTRKDLITSHIPAMDTAGADIEPDAITDYITQTVEKYQAAADMEKEAIEREARKNTALRDALFNVIAENRHSDDKDVRAAFVASCIRMQAFADEHKAAVRELLNDSSGAVRGRAITYAGWAKDGEAFDRVYALAQEPIHAVEALRCLAVIGRERTALMLPFIQDQLQEQYFLNRLTALNCILRIKNGMDNEKIRAIISKMAESDPYEIQKDAIALYPVRERAAEALKQYEISSAVNQQETE